MDTYQLTATSPINLSNDLVDARDHKVRLHWNYSVKGLLRRGETSVLYGPSNSGKSALVCHIGSCIVTGRRFFDQRVRKGIVVHVAAESPESILDRLQAYDIHGSDASMYSVKRSALDLSNAKAVSRFIQDLKNLAGASGEEIMLVVIDTFVRCIGNLDENSATDMTCAVASCEKIATALETHVMNVHHTGKDVDRGGRGSSALRSAVDTELSLKPSDDISVRVAQEKQRTMPMGVSFRFGTEGVVLGHDEDGDDRTTVRTVELRMDDQPAPKCQRAKGSSPVETAIQTALHIWRNAGSYRRIFTSRELLDVLPPELFKGSKEDSCMKKVRGVLDGLSKQPEPTVARTAEGWLLAEASSACRRE